MSSEARINRISSLVAMAFFTINFAISGKMGRGTLSLAEYWYLSRLQASFDTKQETRLKCFDLLNRRKIELIKIEANCTYAILRCMLVLSDTFVK